MVQHRESTGRFYCLARTVKNNKRLTILELIGIYFFAIHGIVALPITVFIFRFIINIALTFQVVPFKLATN